MGWDALRQGKLMQELITGLLGEFEHEVREEDTAAASSGGSLPHVLSTPRMIAWMERASSQAITNCLETGQTSVGTAVNIHHLAATPVGGMVKVRAELIAIDRRRLVFRVEAWDAVEKIGAGEHERFIIDRERFDQGLAAKRLGAQKQPSHGPQIRP
jgi:predicted thioesterase